MSFDCPCSSCTSAEKAPCSSENLAVSVNDVCFSYGENEVLHNVSFQIPPRALVAVIGPNGGGKTTLLHLLLGALEPRYGSIAVLGKTPAEARRHIGFVPQQITFDPDFPITVIESVMLGRTAAHVLGGFRKADRLSAEAALETVGLSALAHNLFSELSGGQRQRVLIAQALVSDPDLLLLDEPTANVDTKTEEELYDLFKELNQTKTIIIVSHNLRVVISHATHILCVNRTVDLHNVGQDDEAKLVPVMGHAEQSWISGVAPAHLETLSDELALPHRGEHAH